jgi:hypothetical protein
MKRNNKIPAMYLRIAGIEPASEEKRSRPLLWYATAVLVSALFVTGTACGPAWDDPALRTSRVNRLDPVDCSGDDGLSSDDDDSCTATAGTTGSGETTDCASDIAGGTASLTTGDASADDTSGYAPSPVPAPGCPAPAPAPAEAPQSSAEDSF